MSTHILQRLARTAILFGCITCAAGVQGQNTLRVRLSRQPVSESRILNAVDTISGKDTLFVVAASTPPKLAGSIWVKTTPAQKDRVPLTAVQGTEVWYWTFLGRLDTTITLPPAPTYAVGWKKSTTKTKGTGADSLWVNGAGPTNVQIQALVKGKGSAAGCGAYSLYYIGEKEPASKGMNWKSPGLFHRTPKLVPEGFIRAQVGSNEKIHRAYIGSDFCGQVIPLLYPTQAPFGRYYLAPLDARFGMQRTLAQSGATCEGDCNTCTSFAKYRITYDVRQNQICVQRRLRRDRGQGHWKMVNSRVIRPGVNRLLDVRMVNFNDLRDSVSAEYGFENLNQDNSAEFLNAVFSIPTGAAQPVEGPKATEKTTGTPGSPPSAIGNDTIATKAYFAKLDTMADFLKAELKTAQAAAVTPDKELLKTKIDAKLSTLFGEYFKAGTTKSIGSGLREVLAAAKKYKVLTDADKEKEAEKKITEMERIYGLLTTYRAFALAPIQMRDYDLLQLQFKLNGKALNQSAYEIYSKGGWKIDFSTGVVLTNLRDSRFFHTGIHSTTDTLGVDTTGSPITKTTYYSTTRESTKEPFDWGVAVLAHFYPRLGLVSNVSITSGAMIRQEGVRWLGGASVLLGRRHRLVLTGGVAWGKVDRLKDGRRTETEESGETVITEDTVVPTQKVNDTGWFVSASWNFGGARLTR